MMRIVTARRISQSFFLVLFLWFCLVSSYGTQWHQLRGWPVNWFMELDPLLALGTALTTRTLYSTLTWALATISLTLILGRFFCGWVCPFGTLHQLLGYVGKLGKALPPAVADNQYHEGQRVKYYILFFLLSAAAGSLLASGIHTLFGHSILLIFLALGTLALAAFAAFKMITPRSRAAGILLGALGFWTILGFFFGVDRWIEASLQTGLLDPIPLLYRSVNLVVLPLVDSTPRLIHVDQRFYDGTWAIGAIFLGTLLLNLKKPRFYCRYLCPLGALMGLLSHFALWKIGKKAGECNQCRLCESHCEGACEPSGRIRTHDCVLCMNCYDQCGHGLMSYATRPSVSGEASVPDLSRRGILAAFAMGVTLPPMVRLSGGTRSNGNPTLIRPPGSLPEAEFLQWCTKCGQCMRVCPTNVIQPAGWESGPEGLWTPVLNFRVGTSGCQLNCVACGLICPTVAIRPISLDEKLGRNGYASAGPVRLGTAFVDRGRCLPWAMDKPCIVCQEVCPVSPKAVFVRECFVPVRGGGPFAVRRAEADRVEIEGLPLEPNRFSTGDFHLRLQDTPGREFFRIFANTPQVLELEPGRSFETPPPPGTRVEIHVRLQQPHVDPERCIGCGMCEHECPVRGLRAIRVTAENESRNRGRSFLL